MGGRQKPTRPLLHLYDDSVPVGPLRSKTMARIRGKDTKPEMELRRAMHAAGLRYRVHDKSLPGTPDISNKSRKVAIFVDGCFWHGCPEHFRVPKTRAEFWSEKVRRNQAKRLEVRAAYGDGWKILEIFECQRGRHHQMDGILRAWAR